MAFKYCIVWQSWLAIQSFIRAYVGHHHSRLPFHQYQIKSTAFKWPPPIKLGSLRIKSNISFSWKLTRAARILPKNSSWAPHSWTKFHLMNCNRRIISIVQNVEQQNQKNQPNKQTNKVKFQCHLRCAVPKLNNDQTTGFHFNLWLLFGPSRSCLAESSCCVGCRNERVMARVSLIVIATCQK